MGRIKDVFKGFLLNDASIEGDYEIPIIPSPSIMPADYMISYDQMGNDDDKGNTIVDFFCDLDSYDSLDGIWNSLTPNKMYDFSRLNNYKGIIEPNYEVSFNKPLSECLYNTYRSRALGYYLTTLGYQVIPNVRWSDVTSYYYAFSGIEKNSMVAVCVPDCFNSEIELQYFLDGFIEMIFCIEPRHVLIKGKIFQKLEIVLNDLNVSYTNYFSSDSKLKDNFNPVV